MKTKIRVTKEVTLTTLEVSAGVRYWEDTEVNEIPDTEDGDNIPCKSDDNWCPIIDIETGKILNWKQGKTANVHFKVVDCCSWKINTKEGECIEKENEYVPGILCPKEEGYGDYIIMDIDVNGNIQGWNKNLINELFEEEDKL